MFLGSQIYSERPKSGRPDFGVFEKCLVVKSSGFQTTSGNRTILSRYRTSGSNCIQPDNQVPKPVLVLVVRLEMSKIISNRTERLKSGQYSPVYFIYFILFYFLFYPGHFLYFKVDRVTSPPPYSGSKLPVLGLRL